MKIKKVLIPVLLSPCLGYAEYPQMNEQQMQQMMEQANKMQACFAKVDQQALMALGQKAQAMEGELRTLCQAGKRSEAMAKAVKFGLSMSQDKNVQAARKCGEMAKGMMPNMDFPTSEKDFEGRDICDGY